MKFIYEICQDSLTDLSFGGVEDWVHAMLGKVMATPQKHHGLSPSHVGFYFLLDSFLGADAASGDVDTISIRSNNLWIDGSVDVAIPLPPFLGW